MFNVYAIYDRTSEESGPLFIVKNNAVALNQFNQFLQKNKQDYPYLPDDNFRLLRLGQYWTDPVMLEALPAPEEVTPVKALSDIEAKE